MKSPINDERHSLIEQIRSGHDRLPLGDLARQLGVRRVYQSRKVADAVVESTADGYVIYLNPDRARTRQRFSVAHELAHILVDPRVNMAARSGAIEGHGQRTGTEDVCDSLAADILMPRAIFARHMAYNELSPSALQRLAKEFDTSLQATSFRAAELATESVIVFACDRMSATGRLAVKWSRSSPSARSLGAILPKGKHVDDVPELNEAGRSGTDRVIKGKRQFDLGGYMGVFPFSATAVGTGRVPTVLSVLKVNAA